MEYNQDETQEISMGLNWSILEPYEQTRQGDPENIARYLNNFSSLSYTSGEDHDAEDLTKYGLEDPSYIIYLEYIETLEEESDNGDSQEVKYVDIDHTLEIHVGANEDGEYYVKTPDSNAVHLMRESTVDNIVEIKPFDYVNKIINLVNIGSVDSLKVIT